MSMIYHFNQLSKPGRTSYSVLRTLYLNNKSWYSTEPSPNAVGSDLHPQNSEPENRVPKIKDVFSISSVDNKFVAGQYQEHYEDQEVRRSVMKSLTQTSRTKSANEPEEKPSSFGHVRLDSANRIKYHGQYDPNNKRLAIDIEVDLKPVGIKVPETKSGQSFGETQLFGPGVEVDTFEAGSEHNGHDPDITETLDKLFPPTNKDIKSVKDHKATAVGKYQFKLADEIKNLKKEAIELLEEDNKEKSMSNFELAKLQWSRYQYGSVEEDVDLRTSIKLSKESPLKSEDEIENELSQIRREVEEKIEKYKQRLLFEEEEDIEDAKPDVGQVVAKEEPKEVSSDQEGETSVFDYVQELRKRRKFESSASKEKRTSSKGDPDDGPRNGVNHSEIIPEMKLDSQGFNSFVDYVPDLKFLRRDELIWMLKKRIIFNDCGIIAINKPHGLITQGQMTTEKNENSIRDPNLPDLLPDFSALLMQRKIIEPDAKTGKAPKLHIVHRLDRESTGVLLLAKDGKTAASLSEMFAKGRAEKQYYCITRGLPDGREGIINIPIEVGTIEGKERMVLRPELREELRRIASPSRDGKHAVTYYKVRSENGNAALLEVVPETGVKHQIRVHLGFGIRCPILGDHKYTYLDKLVPQKLPNDMLKNLNVRPPKVRNIPPSLAL